MWEVLVPNTPQEGNGWGQELMRSPWSKWVLSFKVIPSPGRGWCDHREGGSASLLPGMGLPIWFGGQTVEIEESCCE